MTPHAATASTLQSFFGTLLVAVPPGVFNPWRDRDPTTDLGPDPSQSRLDRLRAHLATDARFLLIGEAAGYQGCKVSGMAFTSERLILEGRIPRIAIPPGRLSSRARPWSEPSATTVWNTLHALRIAEHTVLWNAYPWHPHRPGNLHSNRTPTPAERRSGAPVLRALLKVFPMAKVFAVGRNAELSLTELGVQHSALRHPSMGGARLFADQLRTAVAGSAA